MGDERYMTNLYFEFRQGYIMDVTNKNPKPLYYGTKTILKGGDSVQFDKTSDGIKVTRMKGKEIKVSKEIKEQGVYLLMPFYVKSINKMSVNHRKIYGVLREILGENFYLEEDNYMTEPYSIHLEIDMDVVVKYKYIIKINTSLIRANSEEIQYIIRRSASELDPQALYLAIEKPMHIKIDDEMITRLYRIMNMHTSRMVV